MLTMFQIGDGVTPHLRGTANDGLICYLAGLPHMRLFDFLR